MKTLMIAASLLAFTAPAMAADVGVSIQIGQPGFYGRLAIGDFPPPQVIYPQPVIIERPSRYVPQPPIYLRVPPGHAKHWSKHCRAYSACGQHVYFVQDTWYTNEYAPRYRASHGEHHDRPDTHDKHDKHDKHHGKGHGKGHKD
jgi:hypothetical protein